MSGNATGIPVALVPSNGGFIRRNNPQSIQNDLREATVHFKKITEVRPFGRGGLLCRSSDKDCIVDLLACTMFASVPVSAFIPPHLACTKGLIRGVSTSLTPPEVLEQFSMAGVISVYRCNRVVNATRVPTESVIVTFAGRSCPSEIKAWPLLFRVEPLKPRPLQCHKCWRYGHSQGGCKSATRCRRCGAEHVDTDCSGDLRCCLCGDAHLADSLSCAARAQEEHIVEIIEKRRCSRGEAVAIVKERTASYAGVTSKQTPLTESTLTAMMNVAAEKAVAKHVEPLVLTLSQCLAQMQILTAKLSEFIQTFPLSPASPKTHIPEVNSVIPPTKVTSPSVHGRQEMESSRASPSLNAGVPLEAESNHPGTSSALAHVPEVPLSSDDSCSDMDLAPATSAHKSKRTLSPADAKTVKGPKSKSKKGITRTLKSGDILKQAIASAELESP